MMTNDILLPLGSVVVIAKKLIMIYGYKRRNEDKDYDYIGCYYPIGLMEKSSVLFNKEDINRVLFIGCQRYGSIEFREELMKNE